MGTGRLIIASCACSALAFRDYYDHWKHRNERSRAGKLLLLDPHDDTTLQIFFDDNIGYTNAHIVDVRNVHTGESIAFKVSGRMRGVMYF